MSSISVLNQTPLLDIKNKIQVRENKTITGQVKIRDLSHSASSPVLNGTLVDLITETKSNLYTVSPIETPLNKKHVIVKKDLHENIFLNKDESKLNKYIKSLILDQLAHNPAKTTSKKISESKDIAIKSANTLMNIGEFTLNSSISFTKKIIHIFIRHFNQLSIDKIIDNKIIKKKIKKEEKISVNKIYKNAIKSSGDISSNNILPGKKHSINNVSFHQSKYQNSFFSDEKLNDSIVWKPLSSLNKSLQATNFANQYQENFHALKYTRRLDKNFIYTGEHSLLTVNGNKISKFSPITMLNGFKKVIPNLESRQLLSAYVHPGIFTQAYYDVYSRYPDLSKCKQKNPVISYNIQELNNGKFKLIATNTAELISTDKNVINKHNIFGVKASVLLSKDQEPQITYSSFVQ